MSFWYDPSDMSYDMIRLIWFVDMTPLIWLYDLISVCYSFAMIWFSSVCYVLLDMIWWFDMIWYDLFCSDARVFILLMEVPWACHWSTNGMTLSVEVWLIHGVPIWYDMLWALDYYDMYDLLCRGGVWMHPRYSVLCRVNVSVCLHFFTLELATPFWYLEVSPLRALMIWRICDYMVGDLFEYLVRSARGFPMFRVSIRVSR